MRQLQPTLPARGELLALLCLAIPCTAQQASPVLTTLYSFNPAAGDGEHPQAALAIDGRNLFGTTPYGGAYFYGTIFRLEPPAAAGSPWTEALLYSFTGGTDGGNPFGSVSIGSDSRLITTSSTADPALEPLVAGAVILLTPPSSLGGSWTPTVLYDFTYGGIGGYEPQSGVVIGADGILYGATGGDCNYGCGAVYSLLSHQPRTETSLYILPGNGGQYASLVVMDAAGVLYGTVWWVLEFNGGQSTYGSYVFSVTPPAASGDPWTGAEIHSFESASDTPLGYLPLAGVVIGDGGVLYGTTSGGAKHGSGAVFSLTPPASPGGEWTAGVLYNFPSESQATSPGGLVYDSTSGALYGVTLSGGSYGCGTAFSLNPPSASGGDWTYRLLYTFTGGTDGAGPNSLVISSDGVLYGTTQNGGSNESGTVFSLKP